MRVNQRVTVEVLEGEPPERYASRIEGVTERHLALAEPVRDGAQVVLRVGTELRVTMFYGGGAHAFQTRVIGRDHLPTPVMLVDRPRRIETLQRRQFFRESAVVQTLCASTGEGPAQFEGLTRNLSGGGVCLRTRDVKAVSAMIADGSLSSPFWLELRLPSESLRAVAQVVWCQVSEDGKTADLAFEFVDLQDGDRERLIRYLFVLQREAIRKGH